MSFGHCVVDDMKKRLKVVIGILPYMDDTVAILSVHCQ